MTNRKIESGRLYRSFTVEDGPIDEETRTVTCSFSSEAPVTRSWGVEILSHDEGDVNLDRLQNGGAVLADHDPSALVGVVESAEISNGRGVARLRFGRSQKAEDVFRDIVDGIRPHISVGYEINSARRVETEDGEVYRCKFSPYEISSVSIPADQTVGIGREDKVKTFTFTIEGDSEMEPQKIEERAAPESQVSEPRIDVDREREQAVMVERNRISAISALGEKHHCQDIAAKAVADGLPVADFRAKVLDFISSTAQPAANDSEIGLTDHEARSFSIVKMVNALANPQDRRAQEAAAFELECSDAFGAKIGKQARGGWVPSDITGRRDLLAGNAAQAGNLIDTDLLSASFIDLLRNRSVMMDRCTVINGLSGPIQIPRQASGAQAQWIATENAASVQDELSIDLIGMSLKTIGVHSVMSRSMMIQSSMDVEALVRRDLAASLALGVDKAVISGSGAAGEPLGILNTAGIGSVVTGGVITYENVVELETVVAQANADVPSMAYLTNATVNGRLKTTRKDAGSGMFVQEGGQANGYPVIVTNQVDGGTLIFGNWSDCLIGTFNGGGIDLLVDPYTNSTTGAVLVRVFADADVAVRHPESFSAAVDL